MTAIDTSLLVPYTVFAPDAPSEGPRTVPVAVDFSKDTAYSLDYSTKQRVGGITQLQSIYVDASRLTTGSTMSVVFSGTGFSIMVKAQTQGWYNVAASNPLKIQLYSNTGAALVFVFLNNFPARNASWATS